MQPENKLASRRRIYSIPIMVGGLLFISLFLACGSGLPELRPGFLDRPHKTQVHGRIVEKTYRFNNGPRTVFYKVLEVDGEPIRIPNGFVEFTEYCPVDGIDAVGFTVRGDSAGIYVIQLNGDQQIFERLCDYGPPGVWKGTVFVPSCNDIGWDASVRERVKVRWDTEKKETIIY